MKHAISWFEIPSSNFDRAVKFYGNILGEPLRIEESGGIKNGVFPYVNNDANEAIGGAVVLNPHFKPSENGTCIYLDINGKLDEVLGREPHAGGKVLMPRTDIGFGLIALILDSEGNKVGLHTE